MTPSQRPTSSEERLNKFLARAGVASRRGAEELISAGRVRINGNLVSEMGVKVIAGQDVVNPVFQPVDDSVPGREGPMVASVAPAELFNL
jgi:23S rRNA-/tRNA-specific pseudouridylate synthase